MINGFEPTGNRVEVEEYLGHRIDVGDIVGFDRPGDDLALSGPLGVDLPVTE